MTKPVLFLDTDFIGNVFGQNSGDASRLNNVLDALYENYDVRITDTVWGESITQNINPITGQRYPKDTTLENWLNGKGITETVTGVPPGSNAGEQSIIHALNNPGTDPVLSDPSVPKYIASNDGYFNPDRVGQGEAFSENRLKSFDLVDRLTVDGHVSIEDYKNLTSNGSPDANWRPYQNVTADAVQTKYPDMATTYDPVNGTYLLEKNGQTLTLAESAVHNGIHATGTDVLFDGQTRELHSLGKYAGALEKAGWIGDILGTAWAISEAQTAYSNGDNHSAGSILAGHTGGLLGGFGVGTVSAAGVAALLAIPGVNVGVAAGMLLVGAAGLAGGYLGGSAGESMFKDLYEEITALGLADFSQQLYDDYTWFLPNLFEVTPLGNLMEAVLGSYATAQILGSPLVLDIAGTGINLTNLNSAPVYWDIDHDGMYEASAWIGAGSGLLAIDLDSSGKIDSQAELFGNQSGGAANGFQALAVYDSNSDGVIDSNDDRFDDLVVWMDANANGHSDDGELHTLSSLGITSINLSYTEVAYGLNGNSIRQESTFTINGQTHDIVDAWLEYSNTNTSYAGSYDLDVRTLLLPAQRGYGDLADLHIAMSQNSDLFDMVATLATKSASELLGPSFDLRVALTDIMFEWAGVSGVDPESRGGMFDAQRLGFLEAMVGSPFLGDPNSWPTLPITISQLEKAWDYAFGLVAANLLAQAGFADFFGNPQYDLRADALSGGDFSDDLVVRFAPSPVINGYVLQDSGFSDFYVLKAGDAPVVSGLAVQETINSDLDAILFGGVDKNDLRMWTDYYGNLHIKFSSSDIVTIYGSMDANWGVMAGKHVEQLMFDDGTVWDLTEGLYIRNDDTGRDFFGSSFNDTMIGGAGNDVLRAGVGDDTLIGSGGYDALYGGTGDDTYIFDLSVASSGSATLVESLSSGTDTLHLSGVDWDDVRLWTDSYGGLNVKLTGSDKIQISGGQDLYGGVNVGAYVERITFDDDTVWDLTQGLYLRNDDTGRYISGSSQGDTIIGGAGNDNLYGLSGDDTLIGGGGLDFLYGGQGADTFGFARSAVGNGVSYIVDFNAGDGDRIDVRDLLDAYDPLNDLLSDFIQLAATGSDTYLKVDLDGAGTAHGWTNIGYIYGGASLDVDTMIGAGQLLAA